MDAMDRCKWRKMIKEARWSGWVWVGECFLWYRPTRVVPDQRPLNGCRCCCCYVSACACGLIQPLAARNDKRCCLRTTQSMDSITAGRCRRCERGEALYLCSASRLGDLRLHASGSIQQNSMSVSDWQVLAAYTAGRGQRSCCSSWWGR